MTHVRHDELARFLGQGEPTARCTARQSGLTSAESAGLALVAEGRDNRDIAARLCKSEMTVRNQVSVILDKLGVQTRTQAIVAALAD